MRAELDRRPRLRPASRRLPSAHRRARLGHRPVSSGERKDHAGKRQPTAQRAWPMSEIPFGNGVPYLACILAETRSDPYYIGTAPTPQALDGLGHSLRARHSVRGQTDEPVAILAVWYEECENEVAALLRAAEISRLSHCWQRGLIESSNPQWLDLSGLSIGFPLIVTLPEHKGLSYHLVTDL
jgi:putative endonuclease